MHTLDARALCGLRLREFFALPDRDQLTGLANKKHFTLFGISRIREQDKDGLLLINATEVKEIAVLYKAQRAVGIRGQDIVGVDDHHRTRRQVLIQTLAIRDVEVGRQGLVTHGGAMERFRVDAQINAAITWL
jgi:inorganic pyrophosphatase/exopolyphosphatase